MYTHSVVAGGIALTDTKQEAIHYCLTSPCGSLTKVNGLVVSG